MMRNASPLWSAVLTCDSFRVKDLLTDPNVDVNERGRPANNTPLIAACQNAYVEVVETLLQHPNIEVNATDAQGVAALHHVCWTGVSMIVDMLLERPEIDVNPVNRLNFTPFHLAVCGGHPEVVSMLLKRGADVQTQNPFLEAVKRGSFYITNMILQHGGFDINAYDNMGSNALIYALAVNANTSSEAKEKAKLVRTLLRMGANLDQVTVTGDTVTIAACKSVHSQHQIGTEDVNLPLRHLVHRQGRTRGIRGRRGVWVRGRSLWGGWDTGVPETA